MEAARRDLRAVRELPEEHLARDPGRRARAQALSPARRRFASEAGLGAALLALAVTVLGDLARPGYDAATQYISELGELGAAHGPLVSLGGFLPIGVLVLAFLALAAPELAPTRGTKAALAGIGCVGVAYVVAAFARCEPGCPADGPPRQLLHNAFGLLEYLGGGLGLALLGVSFRARPEWRSFVVPTLVAAAVVLVPFAVPGLADAIGRGFLQRLMDGALFAWIAAAAWRVRSGKTLQPA
ncbi:MAG TPA: DUF998 domain-containing protein [Myxococcota bacterium]|nr:DUF998 domain-containing protein [Myxococcota bacterium]